jgi:hypothetical protein
MPYLSDDLLYSGTSDETTTVDPWDGLDEKLAKLERDLKSCPEWDTESKELLTEAIEKLTERLGAI